MSWIIKMEKYGKWIIIGLFMIAYFLFQTYSMNMTLEQAIMDLKTWINLIFSTTIQIMAVGIAYDEAQNKGVISIEYQNAEMLNNGIIRSVNNEMQDFRLFIKRLNEHEKKTMEDEFLFSIGDKKVEELDEKELKKFKLLKPLRHDIYGFNMALYYEVTKNGSIKYGASIKKNQGKGLLQLQKAFMGILLGAMTINMTSSWANFGQAFSNLAIVGGGMVASYLMTFYPQFRLYTYEIPMKVIRKNTLYTSYIEYKNGTHILKPIVEESIDIVEEVL